MAPPNPSPSRPLSPHLQIYQFPLSMAMSIVHRITGAGLYFGTLILAWWLLSAASGPEAYATSQWFMGSIIGQLLLFGYSWALLHHMLGGVRHLIWDTGRGLDHPAREHIVRATIIGSVSLTILLWIVGYIVW